MYIHMYVVTATFGDGFACCRGLCLQYVLQVMVARE